MRLRHSAAFKDQVALAYRRPGPSGARVGAPRKRRYIAERGGCPFSADERNGSPMFIVQIWMSLVLSSDNSFCLSEIVVQGRFRHPPPDGCRNINFVSAQQLLVIRGGCPLLDVDIAPELMGLISHFPLAMHQQSRYFILEQEFQKNFRS